MLDTEPGLLFVLLFAVAGLAGVASRLRSPAEVTFRSLLNAGLNAGLLGMGIGMVGYETFRAAERLWMLFGLVTLSGLAGVTVLDFVSKLIQKGTNIRITVEDGKNGSSGQGGGR